MSLAVSSQAKMTVLRMPILIRHQPTQTIELPKSRNRMSPCVPIVC
jgi:hypothetical protein